MNKYLFLVFLLAFSSCSMKNTIENGFQTESEIQPIAKAEKLSERYGNGKEAIIKMKVPLSDTSIGYFDIDEVLGNGDLNYYDRSLIQRFYDNIRLAIYNLAVSFGISNKMKYSVYFDLPKIDPSLVVSAKVKKVFFTTEDCRPNESDCNDRSSFSSNFNFLDEFFINVSGVNVDNVEDGLVELDNNEFSEIAKKSLNQSSLEINNLIKNNYSSFKSSSKNNNDEFKEINLIKYENTIPTLSFDTSKLDNSEKILSFDFKDSRKAFRVSKFLNSDRFSDIVKDTLFINEELRVSLHDSKTPKDLFQTIELMQSFTSTSMIIFRLNGKGMATKEFFEKPKFKPLVKEMTMIGRSLFIELKKGNLKNKFLNMISDHQSFIDNNLNIYKVEQCDRSNCLDLSIKDVNLIPLLSNTRKLKIDTYLSVKSLGLSDFKYNGYVELEVRWLPPL